MYTRYSVCNYNSVCVFVTFKSEVGKWDLRLLAVGTPRAAAFKKETSSEM